MNRDLIRKLPKVDEVISEIEKIKCRLNINIPKTIVLNSVRNVIDELRYGILNDMINNDEVISLQNVSEKSIELACKSYENKIRPVINATGITLHTNLGRAPLSKAAISSLLSVAKGYSNLEYNIETGERGSRHDHLENILKAITGAEAAMVVNNNAAATMLCLSALGRGRDVILSRGEMVEIGGSFRIPEIMLESGCRLVEIGTTNKTKLSDYERAIGEETAVILKVHTSNYRISGFTEEANLESLSVLSQKHHIPLVYDLGSGLMIDLNEYGIDEPTVSYGIKSGADVVLFSGDKLLGGSQAGIIIGKKELIDKMKSHPLARAFRVDKLTISALEATLKEYYEADVAMREIPVLNMLTASEESLKQRAEMLWEKLSDVGISCDVVVTENQVGGGSAPAVTFKGRGVQVRLESVSAAKAEEKLRSYKPAIVCKIKHDMLLFDVRTIMEEEFNVIAQAMKSLEIR